MKKGIFFTIGLIVTAFFCVNQAQASGVIWVDQTAAGSPGDGWWSITSSADGTKLAAVAPGDYIHISTDSGATWAITTAYDNHWVSITSSSDGTKLAAIGGNIVTSTDSGATWTIRAWPVISGLGSPKSMTSSADGTTLSFVTDGGKVCASTNSGAAWTCRSPSRYDYWFAVASSADGTKLAAAALDGIYTSTDSGETWTRRTNGNRQWKSIASSADGTKLVAAISDSYTWDESAGDIYTSTDSGITWTDQSAAGTRVWRSVTSSADGTRLAAVAQNDYIYTSTDSGASWTEQTSAGSRRWWSITSSSDGFKLAAAVLGGDIWTTTMAVPPVISLDSVTPNDTSAVVSWTTDIAADSAVAYGLTSAYGSIESDATLVMDHMATLNSLSACTTYHYQITSTEGSGYDLSTSTEDDTFTTTGCTDPSTLSRGHNKYWDLYHKYAKFRTKKIDYQTVKNIQKTNPTEFERLKALYQKYRVSGDIIRKKLPLKDQQDFLLYKNYRGYKLYREYKDKAR